MVKNIIKSNGTSVKMDFEMVMKAYGGLVRKIAKHYKGIYITEDDMQEGYLALFKAFKTYDEINCFSTHATWIVRQRFQHLKVKEVALKRDLRDKTVISMEFDLGDGNTLGEMIEDTNSQFEDSLIDSELIRFIKSNLTEFEIDLLAFNLKYIKAKTIAEKYGMTKQAVSNRNASFKQKIKKLINYYNAI